MELTGTNLFVDVSKISKSCVNDQIHLSSNIIENCYSIIDTDPYSFQANFTYVSTFLYYKQYSV